MPDTGLCPSTGVLHGGPATGERRERAEEGEDREGPSPRTLVLWAGKQVLLVKQHPGHHSPSPRGAQAREPTATRRWNEDPQTSPIKDQMANVLGFAAHMVSVTLNSAIWKLKSSRR